VEETATVVRYVIDPRLSRFTVRVTASGVLSYFGHNPTIAIRDFSGEVDWQTPQSASVKLAALASSLQVADDVPDKDRREIERQMHEEVLESHAFAHIVYECPLVQVNSGDSQSEVTVNGKLTLHGVTNPLPITVRATITGDVLHAFGDFSLRQTDYNIRLVHALGGALKVKDELQFNFDVVARKQG
jgi:polyisoprenoid-binding protein YceI